MNRPNAGQPCYKNLLTVFAVFFVISVAGCTEEDSHQKISLETEPVCDDGVPGYDITLERHLTAIGPSGNDIAVSGDNLWIVESDANTVSRFDLTDETYDAGRVDIGSDRNPYAAAVDQQGDEIWVANFLAESVTIADTTDGTIVAELEDDTFASPSSIALGDDYAYVANVDFRGSSQGFGPGSLTVIDRTSHDTVTTIDTAFENPQFIEIETIDGDKTLIVSGGGALTGTQNPRVESEGGIELLAIGNDPVEPASRAFPLGQADIETVGAPGRPLVTPDHSEIYLASAIAPVLFVFDVDDETWRHDAADPLRVYETDNDVTHRGAIGPDGLLWLTAFNDDKLHLIDTACDEPVIEAIDVGEVADRLEGPQAVTVLEHSDRIEGYYLLSIANALGRLQLTPTGD